MWLDISNELATNLLHVLFGLLYSFFNLIYVILHFWCDTLHHWWPNIISVQEKNAEFNVSEKYLQRMYEKWAEAKIRVKFENSLHPKDLQAELEGGNSSSRSSTSSSTSSPASTSSIRSTFEDLKAGVKEKRGGEKKGKWKARSSESNCNRARYLKIFEFIWKCEIKIVLVLPKIGGDPNTQIDFDTFLKG